jgi:hypothetical protein
VTNKKQNGDPADYSFVLRGYVRHWLGNVWAEYDRINLTDIIAARMQADYSPVSNIGDIWSLEEGSDEGSIVLDIGEVGLNAFLQQFV